MMYKLVPAPNTVMVFNKFSFLKPCRLKLIKKDGSSGVVGYGIGEVIEIKQPRVVLCIASYEPYTEFELPNGDILTDIPDDIKMEKIWEHRPDATSENRYIKKYPRVSP